MIRVNIGCGDKFINGWKNYDLNPINNSIVKYDARNVIPLNSNYADLVYHSHVLEHLTKGDGIRFTKECFRILKKKGIIRIVIPDLEKTIREYLSQLEFCLELKENEANPYFEWITLELLDQLVRRQYGGNMENYILTANGKLLSYIKKRFGSELAHQIRNRRIEDKKKSLYPSVLKVIKILSQTRYLFLSRKDKEALKIGRFMQSGESHQWMYDRYSIALLLRRCGFKGVTLRTASTSYDQNWNKFNLDTINGLTRKPDSLYIEGLKL